MLTESLDKDPAVNARFDKFIRSFYQKFAEKKGIKIHEPRIDFRGFGHFYISEEDLISGICHWHHLNDIYSLIGLVLLYK